MHIILDSWQTSNKGTDDHILASSVLDDLLLPDHGTDYWRTVVANRRTDHRIRIGGGEHPVTS